MDNSGGFMGNAGGNGAAIKAAMESRGMDTSVLDQMGGGSPAGANAVLPAPPPTGSAIPPVDPSMGTTPMPPTPNSAGTPPVSSAPMGNPEKQIILKAMDSALKSINKVEEASAGIM